MWPDWVNPTSIITQAQIRPATGGWDLGLRNKRKNQTFFGLESSFLTTFSFVTALCKYRGEFSESSFLNSTKELWLRLFEIGKTTNKLLFPEVKRPSFSWEQLWVVPASVCLSGDGNRNGRLNGPGPGPDTDL